LDPFDEFQSSARSLVGMASNFAVRIDTYLVHRTIVHHYLGLSNLKDLAKENPHFLDGN